MKKMPRPRTLWLASCAAVLGALAVTGGVLALHHTGSDHDAIHADRMSDRGFMGTRPADAKRGAAPSPNAVEEAQPASPLAMRLKDDGENPSAAWPPGFQPTPERPTPLTMCLKHDTVDGKPICPNANARDQRGNALAMPLR
jgi:hypothetical protein